MAGNIHVAPRAEDDLSENDNWEEQTRKMSSEFVANEYSQQSAERLFEYIVQSLTLSHVNKDVLRNCISEFQIKHRKQFTRGKPQASALNFWFKKFLETKPKQTLKALPMFFALPPTGQENHQQCLKTIAEQVSNLTNQADLLPLIYESLAILAKPQSVSSKIEGLLFVDKYLSTLCLLGKGSFGNVYMGLYKDEHGKVLRVAIKEIWKFPINVDFLQKEIRNLELFASSEYVVRLLTVEIRHGEEVDPNYSYKPFSALPPPPNALTQVLNSRPRPTVRLVMEYMDGGSFHEYLERKKPLPERKILHFLKFFVSVMCDLQMHKMVHRDLKPENLMLCGKPKVLKCIDFGFSRILDSTAKTYVGTPAYLAPEVRRKEKQTLKIDLWSVGIMLYEMAVGVRPYSAPDFVRFEANTFPPSDDKTVPADVNISNELKDLINSLLKTNVEERCSREAFCYMATELINRQAEEDASQKLSELKQELDKLKKEEAKWENQIKDLHAKKEELLRRNKDGYEEEQCLKLAQAKVEQKLIEQMKDKDKRREMSLEKDKIYLGAENGALDSKIEQLVRENAELKKILGDDARNDEDYDPHYERPMFSQSRHGLQYKQRQQMQQLMRQNIRGNQMQDKRKDKGKERIDGPVEAYSHDEDRSWDDGPDWEMDDNFNRGGSYGMFGGGHMIPTSSPFGPSASRSSRGGRVYPTPSYGTTRRDAPFDNY